MSKRLAKTFGRQIDSLFNELRRDLTPFASRHYPSTLFGSNRFSFPDTYLDDFTSNDYDIIEKDKNYSIHLDIPGVRKEDVQISVSNGMLKIESERKGISAPEPESETVEAASNGDKQVTQKKEHAMGTYTSSVRSERFGKSVFQFTLPDDVDSKSIEAKHENGVLELILPKAEHDNSSIKIEVK